MTTARISWVPQTVHNAPSAATDGTTRDDADRPLSPSEKAARTIARNRSAAASERRWRLEEAGNERRRCWREQIESGRLVVRQATADERRQFASDRESYLREHPDEVEQSMKVRAALRRRAGLEPERPARQEPSEATVPCARLGCTAAAQWGRWCSRRCSAIASDPRGAPKPA
jgi:hypothetical protein